MLRCLTAEALQAGGGPAPATGNLCRPRRGPHPPAVPGRLRVQNQADAAVEVDALATVRGVPEAQLPRLRPHGLDRVLARLGTLRPLGDLELASPDPADDGLLGGVEDPVLDVLRRDGELLVPLERLPLAQDVDPRRLDLRRLGGHCLVHGPLDALHGIGHAVLLGHDVRDLLRLGLDALVGEHSRHGVPQSVGGEVAQALGPHAAAEGLDPVAVRELVEHHRHDDGGHA
mmetsp:Transcript_126585/g.394066  ORF Transcript_126585/g.394066 Transcript_126585/m.394066 type:complete len:230 (-) Transcript_126585:184-873(-)